MKQLIILPPLCHQEVAVGELSRGGRLLEEPKMMLFRGNTFSLQVSIQDVPQLLWSIKPFTTCQVDSLYIIPVFHHYSSPSGLPPSYSVLSKPKDSSKDTTGDQYPPLPGRHTHLTAILLGGYMPHVLS